MNIRHIAIFAGLAAISGAASAQSFELRGGAGVQEIDGSTIKVQHGGPFTVQIWVNFPAPRNHTVMALALGYAWSNATANNNASAATEVGNRLGAWSYSGVQTVIPPLAVGSPPAPYPAFFRRSTSTATSNFTHSGHTGVNSIFRYYVVGISPAVTFPAGSHHLASVTFTGSDLSLYEMYGDDAHEFGLQMLTNGSTAFPVNAGYSGFGGFFNPVFNLNPSPPLPLGSIRYQVQAVPEPATLAALGLGLAAIARRRLRKK